MKNQGVGREQIRVQYLGQRSDLELTVSTLPQQGRALWLPPLCQHLWSSSAGGPRGRHQQCHFLPPGQGAGLQVLAGTVAGEGKVAAVMGWGAWAEAGCAVSPGVAMCSWPMAQT